MRVNSDLSHPAPSFPGADGEPLHWFHSHRGEGLPPAVGMDSLLLGLSCDQRGSADLRYQSVKKGQIVFHSSIIIPLSSLMSTPSIILDLPVGLPPAGWPRWTPSVGLKCRRPCGPTVMLLGLWLLPHLCNVCRGWAVGQRDTHTDKKRFQSIEELSSQRGGGYGGRERRKLAFDEDACWGPLTCPSSPEQGCCHPHLAIQKRVQEG